MVWILIPESNEIISSEKIETFNWLYPNLSYIEIFVKINGTNYKICTVQILSMMEEHSAHNSLISIESEDGFTVRDMHINDIRKVKLEKIFNKIFTSISTAKPDDIVNLNRIFKRD